MRYSRHLKKIGINETELERKVIHFKEQRGAGNYLWWVKNEEEVRRFAFQKEMYLQEQREKASKLEEHDDTGLRQIVAGSGSDTASTTKLQAPVNGIPVLMSVGILPSVGKTVSQNTSPHCFGNRNFPNSSVAKTPSTPTSLNRSGWYANF